MSKARSRAAQAHEPRQVRKEAAVSEFMRVPRECREGANCPECTWRCRPKAGARPFNYYGKDFYSITNTADETSLICREDLIPDDYTAEKGFCLLQVVGPLDFSLTGILSSLLNPLAEAGISVFTLGRAVSLLGTICRIEQ